MEVQQIKPLIISLRQFEHRNYVAIAIQCKEETKIYMAEEKAVRETLVVILHRVYNALGVLKVPETEAIKKIIDFIYFNYKNIAPIEIEIAFDLYLRGELPEWENKFNTFDLKLITHVMRSYNKWKLRNMPKEESKEALPSPIEIKAKYYEMADMVAEFAGRCKRKEIQQGNYLFNFIFTWLWKHKVITLTDAQGNEILEAARKIVKKKEAERLLNPLARVDKNEQAKREEELSKELARELFIRDLFKQWEGKDISAHIKQYFK